MLERNIFPWLGGKPITDILPKDILDCLRRIEERGTIETAHRTLQICGQVYRYAVATGRIDRDITPDLRNALPPAKGEHFAAITEPKAVAELLRAIDSYQGSLPSVCALKLAQLVFVRPGELRAAEWQHIDFDAKEWRVLYQKPKCNTLSRYPPKPWSYCKNSTHSQATGGIYSRLNAPRAAIGV